MAKCKYCGGVGYYLDQEPLSGGVVKTVCAFCNGSGEETEEEETEDGCE